ncbi:plasminogen activator inhibitor 1 RNA-binding protein-like isoform X4 [Odontomachus brunneus]|uniref:plasminogen activator inhibitor 1 RNA-binding protein-like isoform X4 n=1 Tax=Odontomachus brunneus TaxID=486640 RepID=UPI0013F214A8|nr:plasminogen activator inhibitor 1 RNA-binding protein-like isoform X4 [Odontomachus brunneus]
MENIYTVTVTNKFDLNLDESEDPLEMLEVREQEKEAKKKERISEKENKSKQQQQQQQQDGQKTTNNKTQKNRVIKDAQQLPSKVQDAKKDQVDKKPSQPRVSGGDRNVKFSGESREERNNRRNREDGERTLRGQGEFRRGPPGEGRETREFRNSNNDAQRGEYGERRGRGGMRGISRGRGGPRGRGGYDNRGKREFDRQSGSDKTGIKPVDKKDGAGSHNWGTHNDEIEESLNQESQDWSNEKPESEATQAATEVKNGDTAVDTAVEEKPVEEESRELTLDEWKALRNNRVKPQYNLRKAGEGEDLSRWKKMYALEKKKEGADEEEEEEEEYDAAVEYPQRVGRQKRVLGIEIQFSDSRRGSGGRGRGGRGRGDRVNGRGYGNRGTPRDGDSRGSLQSSQNEQRSPRSRQNAPKVDDEHDFPSLG